MAIETINPTNNQLIKFFAEYSPEKVSQTIDDAQKA